MIIIILVILVLIFSGIAIFTPAGIGRNLGIGILGAALVAVIGLTMANDLNHVGMHQVKTTESQRLASLTSGKRSTIARKKLGNGTEQVVIYRPVGQKVTKTPLAHTTTTINRRQTLAKVTVTTGRWRFNNGLYRWLFGLTHEDGQVANRRYVFTIPNNWRIVPASKHQ